MTTVGGRLALGEGGGNSAVVVVLPESSVAVLHQISPLPPGGLHYGPDRRNGIREPRGGRHGNRAAEKIRDSNRQHGRQGLTAANFRGSNGHEEKGGAGQRDRCCFQRQSSTTGTGGLRVRGAEVSNGFACKGRMTTRNGKTRGGGRVGWEVGKSVGRRGTTESPTTE